MQFTITDTYLFWWPVTVSIPSDDEPGTFTEQTFHMQFEAISKDRAKKLDDELKDASTKDVDQRLAEVVMGACRDWRDVIAKNGDPVEFHEGALYGAMQFPWFRAGIINAYAEAMHGIEAGQSKAQAKN
ncbi:MAG: hypothetical protein AAF739_03165 [Pseudomonadota bacterium]